MHKNDVVVIGCGIVGASVAYELSGSGADIALVDGSSPGTGATAVSFALVNATAKEPREYYDLSCAGMGEYARLVEELPDTDWLHGGGSLSTSDHFPDLELDVISDLEAHAALEASVRRMVSWGYAAELLDARTVTSELEPGVNLGADPDLPVWYFPDEFCVDAVALAQLLVAQAAARGATGHFGSVVEGVTVGTRSCEVRLADSTVLHADAVVNATGAAAAGIGELVGSPVPLASTWGMTALVHAVDRPLVRVVSTADVELRPERADLVRLHDTTVDGLLPDGGCDRAELTAGLLERAARVMPALASAHVVSSHVGLRPIPADGVPSVGRVPSVPRYYEAVTHSGVTLGPLLGRLLAAEIVEGSTNPLLRPFRPDRFADRVAV